jgi:hypothetical protein
MSIRTSNITQREGWERFEYGIDGKTVMSANGL